MQANLRRVSELGGFTGILEIVVEHESPLVDLAASLTSIRAVYSLPPSSVGEMSFDRL